MSPATSHSLHHRLDATALWAARAFLALVVLFAVQVSFHSLFAHYVVPNRDDWRILEDFFSQPLFEWIVTAQNGHRVPGTLALLALDYHWFGGHQDLLAAAAILCVWLSVGALAIGFAPANQDSKPIALAVLAFSGFALFWAAARHDLVWGMNQGTLMGAMWACIAFASLGAALDRTRRGGAKDGAKAGANGGASLIAVAAAAATAATFCQGIGYSAWGGLLVAAMVCPIRPRIMLALVASATVVLLLFLTGVETIGANPIDYYGYLAVRRPMRLISGVLTFLGTPVADVALTLDIFSGAEKNNIALLSGIAGAATFSLILVRRLLDRAGTQRRHVLSLGLAASSMLGGLMVALNRAWVSDTGLDVRFATWSSLFWIGLVVAIPPTRKAASSAPVQLLVPLALACIAAVSLPELALQRDLQSVRSEHLAQLRSLHLLDVQWDSLARGTTVGPNPERSYRVVARLREDRRSFFRHPVAELPGTVLGDHVNLVKGRCRGRIVSAKQIDTRNGQALQLAGWAFDRKTKEAIEDIVIVDEKGIVQGLGVSIVETARVRPEVLSSPQFPWRGFVRGAPSTGQYVAYGLLDDASAACRIARLPAKLNVQRASSAKRPG